MKRKIFFEENEGKKIFSVLSESEIPEKKLVILSHGFRGTSIGPARSFVNFSRLLNIHGISTLRFDQPNCGNSDGDFMDVSFREWVKTIVFFAKKYIKEGYEVCLLGQSMGATASIIATSQIDLKTKIPCVLLWVPDPESDYISSKDEIAEEAGEEYNMSFWREARDMNFFKCLNTYTGGIHLVYGEKDRYVSEDLRNKTIKSVRNKKQKVMTLKGQDHSSWEFEISQEVFKEELEFLNNYFTPKKIK